MKTRAYFVARFWHIIWTRLYNLWSKGVKSLPRNFYFTWKSPKDFQWMNEKPVKRRGPDGGQSRQSQTFPSVHTSRSKYSYKKKCEWWARFLPTLQTDKDFRQCLSPSVETTLIICLLLCWFDFTIDRPPRQQSKIRTRGNKVWIVCWWSKRTFSS